MSQRGIKKEKKKSLIGLTERVVEFYYISIGLTERTVRF